MVPGNFDDNSIPDFILMLNHQPAEKPLDEDFDDVGGWWQDSILSLCHDDDSVSQVSDDGEKSVAKQNESHEGSHHCHCDSPAPRRGSMRGSIEASCDDCGLPPVPRRQPSCENLISLLLLDDRIWPLRNGSPSTCDMKKKTKEHQAAPSKALPEVAASLKPCTDRSRRASSGSRAIRRQKQREAAAASGLAATQRRSLPPKLPQRKGSDLSSVAI